MWDNLDNEQKSSYKQRTEAAKKDYLKQLAAYRANLLTSVSFWCCFIFLSPLLQNTNVDSTTLAHAQFMSVQQRLQQQQCMPSTSSASDGVAPTMTDIKQSTEVKMSAHIFSLQSLHNFQAVRRMKEVTEQVSSGVSLADLIAAPAQQQARVATTTLTVPQHHLNQQNNAQWNGGEQFRPNDGLVQRCRFERCFSVVVWTILVVVCAHVKDLSVLPGKLFAAMYLRFGDSRHNNNSRTVTVKCNRQSNSRTKTFH